MQGTEGNTDGWLTYEKEVEACVLPAGGAIDGGDNAGLKLTSSDMDGQRVPGAHALAFA
jgi:hypothetical protein